MAAAAQRTNWFAIWVSVAVVAVLVVVGGVVIWLNNMAGGPGAAPRGATVNAETGAITIGDGADEVTSWFDFYCPHCQSFEATYGPTIEELIDDGSITLQLQPIALSSMNAASGTEFSARSASALYCVADDSPEAVFPFFKALFATNPTGPGQTDDELAAMAADAGAPGAADCIADGTYTKFALAQAAKLPPNPETGSAGTPTLLINGEYVPVTGDVAADLTSRLG
ncbi:MAG: DsbA family protein [Microbacterium sp.]|uniref:DsbA family protein n=1 Tax=Microbacterium sp. TaxID=51671 RepID=UPI003A8421D8